MISRHIPDSKRIDRLLGRLSTVPFSYPDVGATRGTLPRGYNVDRSEADLGTGQETFDAAKDALRDWGPFRLPWIRVFPQAEPDEGVHVAVVARVVGAWWTNVSRVIYTIDAPDAFGFAYGTLPHHAETGEELFRVERCAESDRVTYRILAFSRPRHPLARLGYPWSRAAQRRFARDSIRAMREQVSQRRDQPAFRVPI